MADGGPLFVIGVGLGGCFVPIDCAYAVLLSQLRQHCYLVMELFHWHGLVIGASLLQDRSWRSPGQLIVAYLTPCYYFFSLIITI